MQSLVPLYIALLVYGSGVLILGFLGIFDHGSSHELPAHGGHAEGGSHAEGQPSHSADRALGDADSRGHAVSSSAGAASAGAGAGRLLSALRLSVYFALGAGATGLFSSLTGLRPMQGALWSLALGLAAALVSRIARKAVRSELDSSLRSEDFLMEEATIVVPAEPGELGQAELHKFGVNSEIYVRSSDPEARLEKGERVRVVGFSDECYTVEREV
jgi:Membrane protein implicated in regulation of membrane protease activity